VRQKNYFDSARKGAVLIQIKDGAG